MVDYRKIITLEPGKRGWKARVAACGFTVYDVLSYLASECHEKFSRLPVPDQEDHPRMFGYAGRS